MQAKELILSNLYWDSQALIRQLGAVIRCATEMKCLELRLDDDFERIRVLLDLAKDLTGKVEQSAQLWGDASEHADFQLHYASPGAVLTGDVILNLIRHLVKYLRDEGDPGPLVETATAILAHGHADTKIMELITFVVSVLQQAGVKADILQFPDAPQVVMWNDDGATEWNAKVAAGLL